MDVEIVTELLKWLDFVTQSLWDFISSLDIFLEDSGSGVESLGTQEEET